MEQHCQVVDQNSFVPEQDMTLLDVQTFTPLLGTLLLNPSTSVGTPARLCVVTLLKRIRDADRKGDNVGRFGSEQRALFERELIQHIVIGMAHLEVASEFNDQISTEDTSEAYQPHMPEVLLQSSPPEELYPSGAKSPPAAVVGDEVVLATVVSPSFLTSQIVDQEERKPSDMAALAASIPRPPSPIPTSPQMQPLALPEFEPEDIQQTLQGAHLMNEPMPLSAAAAHWHSMSTAVTGQDIREESNSEISLAPSRRGSTTGAITLNTSANVGDAADGFSDFNEEQAAIGRLASMSLMAAVTASGKYLNHQHRFHCFFLEVDTRTDDTLIEVTLDEDAQRAFVSEIERAKYDPVYWVRREATFALGALAKVVPEELVFVSLVRIIISGFRVIVNCERLPYFRCHYSNCLRMIPPGMYDNLSCSPSPLYCPGYRRIYGTRKLCGQS